MNACVAWGGQLVAELILRKVALRELVEHYHGMGIVINLGLWGELVAITEVLLRAATRTVSLRIKCVLVLDTQIVDGCLCRELGLGFLLQATCTFTLENRSFLAESTL